MTQPTMPDLGPPPSHPSSGPAEHVVIGGGPAGLTAAYALSGRGAGVTVLEQHPLHVGGLSQTAAYRGFSFDIGGHRFFSKSKQIEALWTEMIGDDMLHRGRLSRILYKGKFFHYPLKPLDAFVKMGPVETALAISSYIKAKAFPRGEVRSLEDWVINNFGEHLYRAFFKSYTEKVWGIPCTEISADWAAQRIKGLSMTSVVRNALRIGRPAGDEGVIKTLIDAFRYPRLGPGMLWERVATTVEGRGQRVLRGARVVGLTHDGGRVRSVRYRLDGDPQVHELRGEHFYSSMPMRSLIRALDPAAPPAVRRAAEALRYRDFLTVAVILRRPDVFPDNWIYIHEGHVQVGRIQNFKNWSPEMVPDPEYTCLGLEYFCNEGDALWSRSDAELIRLATAELAELKLADPAWVEDGSVVRMRKAYPVYDDRYKANVQVLRDYIEAELPNLQPIGRNGMHKYNNQDHAMMTALLAVRNNLGEGPFNLWKVNGDAEYLEELSEDEIEDGRLVPGAAR